MGPLGDGAKRLDGMASAPRPSVIWAPGRWGEAVKLGPPQAQAPKKTALVKLGPSQAPKSFEQIRKVRREIFNVLVARAQLYLARRRRRKIFEHFFKVVNI